MPELPENQKELIMIDISKKLEESYGNRDLTHEEVVKELLCMFVSTVKSTHLVMQHMYFDNNSKIH